MDQAIKARMLAMVGEYQAASMSVLENTHDLTTSKDKRDRREAELVSELIPVWQAEKSNETIRKAQTEAKLGADPVYLGLTTNIRLSEEQNKMDHAIIDAQALLTHMPGRYVSPGVYIRDVPWRIGQPSTRDTRESPSPTLGVHPVD